MDLPNPRAEAALRAALAEPAPPGEDLSTVLTDFVHQRRARLGYAASDVSFTPNQQSDGCDVHNAACAAQGAEREVVIFAGRLAWTERREDGYSQQQSCEVIVSRTVTGAWKLVNTRSCNTFA